MPHFANKGDVNELKLSNGYVDVCGGIGIALIVDETHHLIGTITDGDIRRAILNGVEMDDGIDKLLEHRSDSYPEPTVAPIGTPPDELLL